METLFSLDNLVTLGLLTLLQAVLGFDNLLYVSLESKRAPAEYQAMVRRLGIGLAIVLRIALLFILIRMVQYFQQPIFGIHASGILEFEFNFHALIVMVGGVFILYTAMKEIWHMMSVDDLGHDTREPQSIGQIVFMIVDDEPRVLVRFHTERDGVERRVRRSWQRP